ncbi:ABC transporter ATP-binding protein [Armatimonas sp.]|uniref:ABC transporter ATP-binding protein n=1 Tax=Armatimonas sp. TaxID=1872638 RepID=UPI0037504A7A
MSEPLLSLENLEVSFPAGSVVRGVSLAVSRGETLGIVGESGSGKTMTALSALRLIPEPGRVTAGRILFEGQDLLALPEKDLRAIRGGRIAMIFQDPMTSLNPVFSIGNQIAESVRLHKRVSKSDAWDAAVAALRRVQIPDPERRARQYPHELSGGMRQRAMIAMALASEPDVLLADEPTTALDVTVQAQILTLIRQLQQELGMAVIFITHDLGVVAQVCDRVAVLYGGQVMEEADVHTLFSSPKHPYTRALLESLPENAPKNTGATAARLNFIPGQPPTRPSEVSGCPFRPRCSEAIEKCHEPLPTRLITKEHLVRCHRVLEGEH